MTDRGCEHEYVFLRQDTVTTKEWDRRVLERRIDDVFFCQKCLEKKAVTVRHEEPDNRSFGWVEVYK